MISACLILCAVLAGSAGLVAYLHSPEANISIIAEAPKSTKIGEAFTIRMPITNHGKEPVIVSEIRFPAQVISAAEFIEARPGFVGSVAEGKDLICKFDQEIAPGATLLFFFDMVGKADGEVKGDILITASDTQNHFTLKFGLFAPTTTPLAPPTPLSPTVSQTDPLVPYSSVAMIIAYLPDKSGEWQPTWMGSGTVIRSDGYILTNYHVAVGYDKKVAGLQVFFTKAEDRTPQPEYWASVVKADSNLDLAVLKLTEDRKHNKVDGNSLNLPAVPIGDSDALELGDSIRIIGYPGIGGETITFTDGIVSGFTSKRHWIKTDATIAGGNSGGLAMNRNGEMIGIPTQAGSGDANIFVDCRVLADTNGDGFLNEKDTCVPIGGFINAIRPINLAYSLIEKAIGEDIASLRPNAASLTPEPAENTILYWTDFQNAGSWDLPSRDDGSAMIRDGKYSLRTLLQNAIVAGRPHLWFRDMEMDIEAGWAQNATAGRADLFCRYRDEKNYYAFEFDDQGNVSIVRVQEGTAVVLDSKERTDGWKPKGEDNQLRIRCQQNKLAFFVNGILLLETADASISSGDIGLQLTGLADSASEIRFDNLFVYGL